MRYSEPKITWLVCAEEPLMASKEDDGDKNNWPGGVIELPPISMG